MARSLNWIPDTLYNYSITSVVSNYDSYIKDIKLFHGDLLFDVCLQLYKKGDLVRLARECENLEVFAKLLKVTDKRNLLHNAFQALMDVGCPIALKLANGFQKYLLQSFHLDELKTIQLGFSLGSFLTDAGWYPESEIVYLTCLELSRRNTQTIGWSVIFECLKRLLKVRTLYCKFKEAESTFQEALQSIQLAERLGLRINFAGLYSEFSAFYFMQCHSKEAYKWSEEAIKCLDSTLPTREIINILCNASKACLMKKCFKRGEFLIKQALVKARKCCGRRTLVMADALMDYGYFLLHIDSTHHSITVYQEVLNILTSILGGQNLRVAAVHEDIAYACYVNEYKTGNFKDAKEHIEKACTIKESLLSEDHFLLPSAKRITALIFEEIANDSHDYETQHRLFQRAEELHLSALRVTKNYLGEMNVLAAKHYGNLGRLYQSMKKYGAAEEMLLKAITIKSTLLGGNDYEVAISVGHLASLYNYDMLLYKEAETLHLQAIDIGITHFGKSYSGLEFEYRGLLRIYAHLGDGDSLSRMYSNLHDWKTLRDQLIEKESKISPLDFKVSIVSPEKIYSLFISPT
ncbi:amyloid protein-binding protein 2 isoform X1 [Parasteatoda tepidariorum]|nr:amyloid protein-binding protein 2 isoform X1 [Parasteatoda tepidariorum]XP_042896214.1 amyloid protein-binding protein 2 isoform X2 [Parasteatoda tepidariorum]